MKLDLNTNWKQWKRSHTESYKRYQKNYREKHTSYFKEKSHEYYLTHKSKYLANNQNRRATRLTLLARLKNRPCSDCQGWFEPCQMDFDHRPGVVKVADIAWLKYRVSITTLLKEVDKCDLVCANCHRLRTNERI